MGIIKAGELKGAIEVLGAFFLAGSSIIACKLLSRGIPILLVGFLSMFIAFLILLPIQVKRFHEIRNISFREFRLMFFQALTGIVLTRMLTLLGLREISALNTGLINSLSPGLMVIFSILFLDERPKFLNIAGISLSIAGMAYISIFNGEANDQKSSLLGILLISGAVVCEVSMTIFRKKSKSNISSLTNTTILFFISLILMLPFYINIYQGFFNRLYLL